uniref:Uncharacterized protein n=1 Tax=Romanomermis culicivorax TaxID=13658 RepID=A0A915HGU0_ROMCU
MMRMETMNDNSTNTPKRCSDLRVNKLFLFESFLMLLLASIAVCVISMKIRITLRSGGATPANVKLLFLSSLIASILRSIQFLFAFFYYILLFVDRRIVVPFDLNLCIVLQYFYMVPAQQWNECG